MDRALRDRYRLTATIGQGGMGTVYLADDLRLPGRRCAVKRLDLPTWAPAYELSGMAARFAAEAAVLARLDHPGLPGVSDYFESEGSYFLVMDYVPGDDLRSLLVDALRRGRRLEETAVVRWADALCDILSYLHRQDPPVVHRDIKPANIKVTADGQVRLVDFGLAVDVGPADGPTRTSTIAAGSLPYEPLEQYGACPTDPSADIYALGATLYHLLCGSAPATARERFLRPDALAPLDRMRPGLSTALQTAITAAMELHPASRPQTADAFRAMMLAEPRPTSDDSAWTIGADGWLLVAVIILAVLALAVSIWP